MSLIIALKQVGLYDVKANLFFIVSFRTYIVRSCLNKTTTAAILSVF